MNKIEEKIEKKSFVEKKWEWREHFGKKVPTPNWGWALSFQNVPMIYGGTNMLLEVLSKYTNFF
jgi:hypothetical protein